MQWSHKKEVALNVDYPEGVKRYAGEVGFYETPSGEIIRVFGMRGIQGDSQSGGSNGAAFTEVAAVRLAEVRSGIES